MFSIEIDDRAFNQALSQLAKQLADTRPLTASIAAELLSLTELNFEREGNGIAWPALADSTIARRTKKRQWPGKILQITGDLANSYQVFSDTDHAAIGSNVPYAAIHHLGGEAGKHRKTVIPARPHLPVDENGSLTDEARVAVMDNVLDYFSQNLR